jgi:predicted DNA-binding transcriptional regulator AlpA
MIRLLRFKDLRERGVVNSWPQLKRLQEKHSFPMGRLISPNTRAWDEAEIEDWYRSCPTASAAPKGVAKTRRGNPRKKADTTEAATA